MNIPILTIMTLVPLIVGIICLFIKSERVNRAFAFAAMGLLALLGIQAVASFQPAATMQYVERIAWLPALDLDYHVGIDGLGLVGLLLSIVIFPIALAAPLKNRDRLYPALVLLLQAGTIGTFTAQNFMHFFLYWELSLIPAFFLVRRYGTPLAREASVNFFIQTMAGSIAMLAGFAALFNITGTFTFAELIQHKASITASPYGWLIFIGIFLGLAVKVPIFGLHTWLPATYASTPPPVTMLLTGVMSKMGVYGFVRILLPAFPHYLDSVLINILGLITILYASACALAQTDIRRILAYSSIAHLGFCLLAVFAAAHGGMDPLPRAAAITGTILQIASHGIIASGLYFCLALIEERTGGARDLSWFSGLRARSPILCATMGLLLFASLGLPGLSGFVAELLMMQGIAGANAWVAFSAAPALLLTALFSIKLFQSLFYGGLPQRFDTWNDLRLREILPLAPLILIVIILGWAPSLLTKLINPTTTKWLEGMP